MIHHDWLTSICKSYGSPAFGGFGGFGGPADQAPPDTPGKLRNK